MIESPLPHVDHERFKMRVAAKMILVLVVAVLSPILAFFFAMPSSPPPARDVATVKKHMTRAQRELGDPIKNSMGMMLVPIPPGEFWMGDERNRPVMISKPFYLSMNEITQQQYEKVMGSRPWQGRKNVRKGPDYPATWVSWDDAQEFCRKLSEQEGVQYRLPTEAEWEYACRAGTETAYSFGDDVPALGHYAWFRRNALSVGEEYAHRIGLKLPNPWGLYDMHGNVSEWCQDGYARHEIKERRRLGLQSGRDAYIRVSDPTGPTHGDSRIVRGGSFNVAPKFLRSTCRLKLEPANRNGFVGFRVLTHNQFATPARTKSTEKETVTKVTTEKTTSANSTRATEKLPDGATVKKHLTPAQLELGDPVVDSIGMVLVPIPAGEFQMGSSKAETPQHLVKITKPFYLSAFEVTREQYEKVMGVRRPLGSESYVEQEQPGYSAVYVSWNDAMHFCRKLSEREGVEYRLPTEAQWEYACRAATTTVYSFGDDVSKLGQYAWYRESAVDLWRYVGQKLPNPWGLYDMHGNVWEWCQDWYAPYGSERVVIDPKGPAQGRYCLLRGGSFLSQSSDVRSSIRHYNGPDTRIVDIGFRVARTYP